MTGEDQRSGGEAGEPVRLGEPAPDGSRPVVEGEAEVEKVSAEAARKDAKREKMFGARTTHQSATTPPVADDPAADDPMADDRAD